MYKVITDNCSWTKLVY